jgi:hypothetical protein
MKPHDYPDDWVPPKPTGEPDISVPAWQFQALLRGAFNRSMHQYADMARADSNAADQVKTRGNTLRDEDKPPKLAADRKDATKTAAVRAAKAPRRDEGGREITDEDILASIVQAVRDLDERLTQFEERKAADDRRRQAEADAARVLTELEDAMAQRYGTEGEEEDQ